MLITIDDPKEEFSKHINEIGNSRIFFNGKFGVGKSYFLNKFFEENEEYNLFWISPINYVVGANQDIFEWIKVDIAKDLLFKYLLSEEKDKFSENLFIQSYIYLNAGNIFSKLILECCNQISKAKLGIDFLDRFKEQIEKFKEFKEKINEGNRSDEERIADFLNQSFQIKGSIYEDDLITRALRASLEVVKKKSEKESILIVDDLDRLDPDHIFRILNILSVHNDHFDANKFGFDKVILVCDYENLKNIYRHRYGSLCDFEGYIAKFYSYTPFNFTITQSIIAYCQTELREYEVDKQSKVLLQLLLTLFFESNSLRTRNLKKISSSGAIKLELDVRKFETIFTGNSHIVCSFSNSKFYDVDFSKFDFLKVLYLLAKCFGGMEILKAEVDRLLSSRNVLKNLTFRSEYLSAIYSSLCVIAHIAKNKESINNIFITNELEGVVNQSVIHLDVPRVTFFGKMFVLPIKWGNHLRYETGHFFLDANPMAGLTSVVAQGARDEVSNFLMLMEEVSPVIDFVIESKLFPNLL